MTKWNSTLTEEVLALWQKGHDSSRIRAHLQFEHQIEASRSAVLGVIHRNRCRAERAAAVTSTLRRNPNATHDLMHAGKRIRDEITQAYRDGASNEWTINMLRLRHGIRTTKHAVQSLLAAERTRLGKLVRTPKPVVAVPERLIKVPPPPPRPSQSRDVGEPESRRISIAHRTSYECSWIAGDPRVDPSMCGHETGGGSWCPYHQAKAFGRQPVARRRVGGEDTPRRSHAHAIAS